MHPDLLRVSNRAVFFAALIAARSTVAGAQICSEESRSPVRPGFGFISYVQSAQWTHPIGLNVSLGCSAGNSWPKVHPVVLADIGVNGGSLVVGLGNTWHHTGEFARGLQLRAVATRTWGDPWAIGPEQTYAGVEIRALWQNSLGVGLLQRIDAGGRGQRLLTASIGFGL